MLNRFQDEKASPSVLIYRRKILPFSETFISRQISSLTKWRACLVGAPMDEGASLEGIDSLFLELPNPTALTGAALTANVRRRLAGAPPERNQIYARAKVTAERLRTKPWFSGLAARSPKLLHIHFGTNAEEAWPLALALNLPTVVTLHGYDAGTHADYWKSGKGGRRYRKYPAALLEMEQYGTKFIAVSDAIVESALEYGLSRSSIRKILIGVDTSTIKASPLPMASRPQRILFVGRFVEKKGVDYLLRAFKDVESLVPNAELRLIGTGRLEAELKSIPTGKRVTFVGKMSAEDVLKEMHEARVLCAPSVRAANGDSEGLPTVITEAQACGLPVVTSARGGRTEGILDGVTGIAFPERDHDALIRSLVHVLTDTDFATRASAAARRFAETTLEMSVHTKALEQYYDELTSDVGIKGASAS